MARPQFTLRKLFKPIVDWIGFRGEANFPTTTTATRATVRKSCSTSTSCSSCSTIKTDQQLWDMFFTPYIWAGVRFRDVSRLWTGASKKEDESGNIIAVGQVVTPENEETEQLEESQWLLDERIKHGMKQVLEEISYSKIIFGKSVHEILWMREKEGEHAGKIVADDLINVDPTLFVFDPEGFERGMYLQRPDNLGKVTYEKVDERRFLVVTNHMLFDDANGISELEPLRRTEERRNQAEKDWGRGSQRHGQGHILGYYGAMLRGNGNQTDRDFFEDSLKEMSSDTVTMLDENNKIEALEVSINSEVFKDLSDEFKGQESIVLTGSTSTFLDDAGGTKARLEASEVQQESQLEQLDSADISEAISYQLIRRFCDYNWPKTDPYPYMQLISPKIITPTTTETQVEQEEIIESEDTDDDEKTEEEGREEEEVIKESIHKFQEEDEDKREPEAIPPVYRDFPDTTPEPEIYQRLTEQAQAALTAMPAKNFPDVHPEEAGNVFTVKRLRKFQNPGPILEELKAAIIPTLALESEAEAWIAYHQEALQIFKNANIPMTPKIRGDLIISFRQARQNAYSQAVDSLAETDDGIVGFRVFTQEDDRVRFKHSVWHDVAMPIGDERWSQVKPPSDFGCRCWREPVFNAEDLTPEDDIPEIFPGDTYNFYTSPRDEE